MAAARYGSGYKTKTAPSVPPSTVGEAVFYCSYAAFIHLYKAPTVSRRLRIIGIERYIYSAVIRIYLQAAVCSALRFRQIVFAVFRRAFYIVFFHIAAYGADHRPVRGTKLNRRRVHAQELYRTV